MVETDTQVVTTAPPTNTLVSLLLSEDLSRVEQKLVARTGQNFETQQPLRLFYAWKRILSVARSCDKPEVRAKALLHGTKILASFESLGDLFPLKKALFVEARLALFPEKARQSEYGQSPEERFMLSKYFYLAKEPSKALAAIGWPLDSKAMAALPGEAFLLIPAILCLKQDLKKARHFIYAHFFRNLTPSAQSLDYAYLYPSELTSLLTKTRKELQLSSASETLLWFGVYGWVTGYFAGLPIHETPSDIRDARLSTAFFEQRLEAEETLTETETAFLTTLYLRQLKHYTLVGDQKAQAWTAASFQRSLPIMSYRLQEISTVTTQVR